jgi:hypothetical protein
MSHFLAVDYGHLVNFQLPFSAARCCCSNSWCPSNNFAQKVAKSRPNLRNANTTRKYSYAYFLHDIEKRNFMQRISLEHLLMKKSNICHIIEALMSITLGNHGSFQLRYLTTRLRIEIETSYLRSKTPNHYTALTDCFYEIIFFGAFSWIYVFFRSSGSHPGSLNLSILHALQKGTLSNMRLELQIPMLAGPKTLLPRTAFPLGRRRYL